MRNAVMFHKEFGKPLEITILAISDWEGFEKLIKFVQKYYFAEIIEQYDGPGARKWILEIRGNKFELVHDDGYSNYFVARNSESEEIITQIGKDLAERLKGC